MKKTENEVIDVLVADDEESMREFLEIVLGNEGLRVKVVSDGDEAIDVIATTPPTVFLQDLRMGGLDGMDLLRAAKELEPDMPVLVMTAFSSWETAVEAMRLGAFDYLRKPFDTDHVRSVIQRALEAVEQRLSGDEVSRHLVGNTESMRQLLDLVKKIAPTDSTVLVSGESGCGKELIARAIHSASYRNSGPFVAVNCSAFSENLLESELFGHRRGSFTDAVEDRKGVFVNAHGGTLFLDEVADMSLQTQAKILRALEERKVIPVGGDSETAVDVRVIAATNKNLEEEIHCGRFREDLFYRLNVIPAHLPPLRERLDDIPLLAGHFLARYARKMSSNVESLSLKAQKSLMEYSWPGNVRELENVIQRHVALADGDVIEEIDIGSPSVETRSTSLSGDPSLRREQEGTGQIDLPQEGFVLDHVLEDIERNLLAQALERTEGNLTKAAKILGMSYRSIRYKVKKLQVRSMMTNY
ncbi:MAG TPA: sigma-54-dependent Fis family transcriptional regulator [Planctomycetes bacterium]|nr:sigma-54-dependent Fis family transcriptional regulator [Planctomycetota bacterium]HIN80561.1 sigma-54-dependent Fis family transcriptional regulator [Planctomycetota bacterium]